VHLELSLLTYVYFALSVFLWGLSIVILWKRRMGLRLRWKMIFLSLFGFAWIGFGVDCIIRFLALAYDAELFRATQFPLWFLPNEFISRTWIYLVLYWVAFCGGYFLILSIFHKRTPRVLKKIDLFGSMEKIKLLDLLTVISTLAVLVSNFPGEHVPQSLVTPVGLLGSLYVIPSCAGWYLYFCGKKIGLRRFIYMFPGVLIFFLSPYREHILSLVLTMVIPALLIKKDISLKKTFGYLIALLLVVTVVNSAYRNFLWEGGEVRRDSLEMWEEKPDQAPWVRLINRFHGFDSMALTVFTVPSIFPYSKRNVVTESFVAAFVPRAIYINKSDVKWGREFSTTIWALDESGRIVPRPSAMIAPSITGDLYSIDGLFMVIVGGILWGALIGYLDGWILAMGPAGRCVVLAIFGLRIAGGFERDFVNAAATTAQMLIVLFFVLAILPLKRKGYPSGAENERSHSSAFRGRVFSR
jgi:hypothetical protein